MSEVVALQPPYADMRTGDNAASVGQIVEMTKPPSSIRPTLPQELDEDVSALIDDCWNADPSLRPSFEVIVMRLRMVAKVAASSHRINVAELQDIMRPRTDKKQQQEEEHRQKVITLCKEIHEVLWHAQPGLWDERAAATLVRDDAMITALDPVLNDIVKAERGSKAIRSCGELMVANIEDGANVIPDPLLDDDIVIDFEKRQALLTARFSVSAAKAKTKKSSWSFDAKKEFDGLLEHALAEQAAASGAQQTPLAAAVAKRAGEGGGKATKKTKVVKKKKRKLRTRQGRGGGRAKKGSVEETFDYFLKAARFVRYGDGVRVLHPSVKLRLFGLMKQAQQGDCPVTSVFAAAIEEGKGSRSTASVSLQQLKRKAWASQKGKSRKEAMEEYVKTISEVAPQWRLANLIAGRQSNEDGIEKPRRMMWVIRVDFAKEKQEKDGGEEQEEGAGVAPSVAGIAQSSAGAQARAKSLQATSLHIVQSANASQTKAWFEDRASADEPGAKAGVDVVKEADLEKTDVDDDDGSKNKRSTSYLASLPKTLTADDCLVDVDRGLGKFKNIDDQNEHFVKEMLAMAREGRDKDDGWKLLARLEPESIDVHEREVPWSSVTQMRSRATASCGVDQVGDFLMGEYNSVREHFQGTKIKALREMVQSENADSVTLFEERRDGQLVRLCYQTLDFPWPLSPRDCLYTSVYLFVDKGVSTKETRVVG